MDNSQKLENALAALRAISEIADNSWEVPLNASLDIDKIAEIAQQTLDSIGDSSDPLFEDKSALIHGAIKRWWSDMSGYPHITYYGICGTYQERSKDDDDLVGIVTCSGCSTQIKRWG